MTVGILQSFCTPPTLRSGLCSWNCCNELHLHKTICSLYCWTSRWEFSCDYFCLICMYLRPSSTPHWQAFIMVTVVSFVLFDEGEYGTGINQLANLVCTTCLLTMHCIYTCIYAYNALYTIHAYTSHVQYIMCNSYYSCFNFIPSVHTVAIW